MEKHAKEVLLLHGTTADIATSIRVEGFDDRLSNRAMYGNGIHLSTDPCKVSQYCKGDAGSIGNSAKTLMLSGFPIVVVSLTLSAVLP